jgi:hypothetical protein
MTRENIKRPVNNKAGKPKKQKNEEVILPPIVNRYASPDRSQIVKPLTDAPPLIRRGLVPNSRQNNYDSNLKFP